MNEILVVLIVLLLMVLMLLTGAGIGYMVTLRRVPKQEETNSLTKEEMDAVRQVINLLSFTGEPQRRGDE